MDSGIFIFLGILVASSAAGLLCYELLLRYVLPKTERQAQFLQAEARGERGSSKSLSGKNQGALWNIINWLADAVQRVDPLVKQDADDCREKLSRAGLNIEPETFRACKLLAVVAGVALGLMLVVVVQGSSPASFLGGALVGGVMGWAIPRLYLEMAKKERVARLEAQLPDAMELLGVALAAGSPVEQCFKTVAANLKEPLASEFLIVDREVNLAGHTREKALTNLAERCESRMISNFVAQLVQAINQGTALIDGLQRQAAMAREAAQAATLERIRKMPVKLDIVLSTCFLPPTVILVIVPTVVSLFQFLGSSMS